VKLGLLFATVLAVSGLCLNASLLQAQDESGRLTEEQIPASSPPAKVQAPAQAQAATAAQASERGTDSEPVAAPARAPIPHHYSGAFYYTVRPGDSLGSLASTFGIQVSDIAHANRIDADSVLMVGQTLRIPNPFAARMRELSATNDKLTTDLAAAQSRADTAVAAQSKLKDRVTQLTATGHELQHEVTTLPWWRGAVYTSAIIALLMLGVTTLAIIEWFLLRRRFVAVAEMNESLRRLDQRYRTLFAKAELRMQELYGRRRGGMADDQERPKIPEEAEIVSLDQQLREVLERHLEQLGGPVRTRRGRRWHEDFSGVTPPVEARTVRR
jgi:LysM repeat protein